MGYAPIAKKLAKSGAGALISTTTGLCQSINLASCGESQYSFALAWISTDRD
jgi:hypothetical protein